MVHCITAALIVGAIVGIPLGIKIYKSIPVFVGDSVISSYVGTYIDEHYASEISGLGATTEAASSEETTSANTETATEAESTETTEE